MSPLKRLPGYVNNVYVVNFVYVFVHAAGGWRACAAFFLVYT